MSIVRMGEDGSEVYLYHTDEGVRCHWCHLGNDTTLFSDTDVISHLRDHEAAGHHVPAWVVDSITVQGAMHD